MDSIQQAVILAGGRGERLRPLTDSLPKPLVPVCGIPFLDYLLQSLVQVGIRKFLLLLGYKSQMIVDRYTSLSKNLGLEIEYSIGTVEDATGRRLLNAYPLLDEAFLLLYGDNYWSVEWKEMMDLYREKTPKALVTVFGNKDGTSEYGFENNIRVGKNFLVEQYDKKRSLPELNGVDIGYFIFRKKFLDEKRTGNISLEEALLPQWIANKELMAYVTNTSYYYVTDVASLKKFETFAQQKNLPCLG